MSENEIKAAMTPEEWADGGDNVVDGYIDFDGGVVDVSSHYTKAPERSRHALAALALHGQPFGFTWEMVDALRECVSEWESEQGPLDDDEPATREQRRVRDEALAAIAVIASLLPPREPETHD